jgi:hypothetical protein
MNNFLGAIDDFTINSFFILWETTLSFQNNSLIASFPSNSQPKQIPSRLLLFVVFKITNPMKSETP